jgi:hypothetical protein
LIPTPHSRGFFAPAQVIARGGKQDQRAARQLRQVQRVSEHQIIDNDRHHRIDKRQEPVMGVGSF